MFGVLMQAYRYCFLLYTLFAAYGFHVPPLQRENGEEARGPQLRSLWRQIGISSSLYELKRQPFDQTILYPGITPARRDVCQIRCL